MKVLIPILILYSIFILPQVYNTWFSKNLSENWGIPGFMSGTNTPRSTRKRIIIQWHVIILIILIIAFLGPIE